MFYQEGEDQYYGVLNDFDLASVKGGPIIFGSERTGTIPFMALDLLDAPGLGGEVQHLYRHDLESFFWVLMWLCHPYRPPPRSDDKAAPLLPPTFAAWTTGAENCRVHKNSTVLDRHLKAEGQDVKPTLEYEELWETVGSEWFSLLSDQVNERKKRKEKEAKEDRQAVRTGGTIERPAEEDDVDLAFSALEKVIPDPPEAREGTRHTPVALRKRSKWSHFFRR